MKKFNINSEICIRITVEGWEHLRKRFGEEYIKHSILPYETLINDEVWYRLQLWSVFDLLPTSLGCTLLFETDVLLYNEDLTDIE